jgi:hypothetical protein
MKTKSLITIFAIAVVISCSKEQSIILSENQNLVKDGMMVFKNLDEYKQAVNKSLMLNRDELQLSEESNNFSSYGRLSEVFYSSFDFETFESVNEIKKVANSNHFIEMNEVNGELYLDISFYNHIDRYIMNENRMYQISDTVLKVFKNGIAYANISEINLLKSITGKIFNPSKHLNINFRETIINEAVTKECYGGTERETSGNERIKIDIYQTRDGYYGWDEVSVYAEARPYRKTLGIWYWVSGRTINAALKWKFAYSNNSSEYIFEQLSWVNYSTSFIQVRHSQDCPPGTFAIFYGYNFQARVPATEYAILVCPWYF